MRKIERQLFGGVKDEHDLQAKKYKYMMQNH